MKLGEVCFLTENVRQMADFYKKLLKIENNSDDEMHQTLIAEETMLTIYNDGTAKNNRNQNMTIAFTCEKVEDEYQRLKEWNVEIIEAPVKRPWGATNMSFYDPDRNIIFLRSIGGNE